jgi:hypothetical protein
MKRIILAFFLFTGTVWGINAQDIITQKNGDEIKAKVIEVGINDVKYKKFSNESGPTYTLSKSDIFMIKYENGEKDIFDKVKEVKQPEAKQPEAKQPAAANTNNSSAQNVNQKVNQNQQSYQNQTQSRQQEEYDDKPVRKGYVGLGIGGASMMDNLNGAYDVGTQVNINFGYLFSKNIGIAASFFSTDFPSARVDNNAIGLQGIMVGPLLSTFAGASEKVELDLRPMIGSAQAHVTIGNKSGRTTDDAIIALGLGVSARFNLSNYFSLSANLDYFNGEVDGINMSSVGIMIGANYRF